MANILKIDFFLTYFLKNLFPDNLFFQQFFSFFSLKGYSFFIWVIMIIFVVFFEEKKHPGISKKDKQFIFSFLFAFILTILIVELPLKNFFHRLRPYASDLNQSVWNNQQSFLSKFQSISADFNCYGFSFPSGHAATAFASATILAFFDKKRKWFYYLVATLIAYSRIFLLCHYFFDVVVGGILGYAIGKMVLRFTSPPHKTSPDRL